MARARTQVALLVERYEDLWQIRVGDNRVVYTIRDAELVVVALRIAHRSGVYRSL